MPTTSTTRAFIESLFQDVEKHGLGREFLDSLSDDVFWTATGTSPMRGQYEGKAAYTDRVLHRLRERIESFGQLTVDRILVDGEWAAVNFHSAGAKARNGLDFSMEYCWLMRVQDGKILEVVGFFDSKKMCDLFEE